MALLQQARTDQVQVRQLAATEAGDVVDAVFDGLSDESRRLRFHVPMSRLPDYFRDELTALDGCDRAAVGAWADGRIVGIARLGRASRHDAEAAVAVVDAWHGRGVGKALLVALADLAADLGYERLVADVLDENAPMLRLLASVFPDASHRQRRGVVQVICPLAGRGGGIAQHAA
jgi:RimJ/RimL family protein N-acetyltransferase